MTLTKTQINYLSEKLEREVRDRVFKYTESIGLNKNIEQFIAKKLIKGKLKLLSAKEIVSLIKDVTENGGWYRSIEVTSLINQEQLKEIREEFDRKKDKVNEYERKLVTAKQNAMDMYVLGGVDIQTALKEFDKIDKEIDKE